MMQYNRLPFGGLNWAKPKNPSGRVATVLFGLALILNLALGAAITSAGKLAKVVDPAPVTVPAGGTATLTVRGFCLDFGKPFPTSETMTKGLAADKIREAFAYAIQKGYTEGNPQQVEQAIWFLRDNTWHNPEHAIGQEIVDNATSEFLPVPTGNGMSLSDAVAQNKVTITASFAAQTADHFYGDARIQIKNTGTADVQVYIPTGTVFTVPGSNGQFQDLAAYTLADPAAQVTATAVSTSTPAATSTVAGTTPTAVSTAVQTPTTVSTVAVATATTEVATAVPTATSLPTGNTLPQTGSGDSGMLWLVAIALVLSLSAVGLGASLRHKRA
jgi:LPXTG-motif cell wall-anchored protein